MAATLHRKRKPGRRYRWLRRTALERADYSCERCGKRPGKANLEMHHIVPVGEGGADYLENVVMLCYDCHQRQHAKGATGKIRQDWREYTRELQKL